MDCVFCDIIGKNDSKHEIVWQDEKHVAFLAAYPVQKGHLLIIPREHVDYAFDLSPEVFGTLLEASRRLAIPLKTVFSPKRVELVIAGYEVPHVHVHLIPSNHGPDLSHPQRHDVPPEELRLTGEQLRVAFKDVPPIS